VDAPAIKQQERWQERQLLLCRYSFYESDVAWNNQFS